MCSYTKPPSETPLFRLSRICDPFTYENYTKLIEGSASAPFLKLIIATLVGAGVHPLEFAPGHPTLHLCILHSLLDFAKKDRPVFCKGLMRCQCHDYRDTSIKSGDGNRRIIEYGIHEGCHLGDEALGIALDEEAER